jgi:hypothetical protein
MDELIRQIVAKTGINEAQARTAVETVVGFLKERLPEPLRSHVDGVLASAGSTLGKLPLDKLELDKHLGAVANTLGGLFGKK